MVSELTPIQTDRAILRRALARLGVSLFEHTPAGEVARPSVAELAELVIALAESRDARLEASIPCLLAVTSGERAHAVVAAAAVLRPALGIQLGWLYRLTRALVDSRRPDLERLFGALPELPPSELETVALPDPSVLHGEATLWAASERARDRGEPDVAGGVVRLFDKWIRLRADEVALERA